MGLAVTSRGPGGEFAAPVTLAPAADVTIDDLAVGVAADGAAVVAWSEEDYPRHRVRVARAAAGGRFAIETVARGRNTMEVEAGIDDAGSATVVWSRPRRGRDDVIAALTAGPGPVAAPRQRIGASGFPHLVLAVAPDGGALLAADGVAGLRTFERPLGATRFAPAAIRTSVAQHDDGQRVPPAVALARGGAAVVAWVRADGDRSWVDVAGRGRGEAFSPVRVAGPASVARPGPLTRLETTYRWGKRLDAAVLPDGQSTLAWLSSAAASRVHPVRVSVVRARSDDAPVTLGPAGRSADSVAALVRPETVLWTDNLPAVGDGVELRPAGSGRLHRALPDAAPLPGPAAPALQLSARPQRVRYGDPVVVTARCSAACDLRAGSRLAFGAAELDGPGAVPIRVYTSALDAFVGDPVTITVQASAPGGHAVTTQRIAVRVTRAFVPRPQRPRAVRVRRRGDRIVVTWRTARPARSQYFVVGEPGGDVFPVVRGRGRTRFRAAFRHTPGERAIEITWSSTEPRFATGHLERPLPPR
jgi:hypothetical protein